jgi:phosphate transport system substrate-binding protein
VALDCLAVFVHKDNPIKGLTFDQIDSIFSKTRARGYSQVTNWGQLGLKGEWASQELKLFGRNPASGTYLYFKEHALKKGDYLDSVSQMPGSAGVVEAVANNRNAIGYSGIGYKTSGVRAVPLGETADDELAQPTFENALKGTYPLGRTLYIYVNQKPNEAPSLLVKEFIKFVLSKEGQEVVVKDGFGSLPAKAVEKQLELIK